MTTMHTYPYNMVDNHLVLSCHGRRILLDTGASLSFAETGAIAFAGKEYAADSDLWGVHQAEISNHVGTPLDGLVGGNILVRYDTVIDPSRREVRVYEDEPDFFGTRLPIKTILGIPFVQATVAGQSVTMIFDTGAKVSYFSSECARPCHPTGTLEDFYPGIGSFIVRTSDVPVTLGLSTITITAAFMPTPLWMALSLVGASGILGSEIFEHFKVCYAPRRRTLTLCNLNGRGV
jgi:hypothetical protein